MFKTIILSLVGATGIGSLLFTGSNSSNFIGVGNAIHQTVTHGSPEQGRKDSLHRLNLEKLRPSFRG